ncbi:helix-turn-helix domain-containing protein [Tenacibaculum amylolyticum]|uniref:helix-turn-helix domain-containing protein n=1 Tax=Tenacibaculum amylolyticum TaxID=104269 RepID=UPI00389514ED
MNIQLSLFDLLILIGITTGIICSIVLFKKSKVKPSNKFLALGILAFVWLNTKTLLHSFNLWEMHGFGFFPNSVELALPPLFYFYVISLFQPNFKFRSKNWVHFFPFFLSQTYSIIVYLAVMQTRIYSKKTLISQSFFFDQAKNIDEYILIFISVFYFYYGFQYVKKRTENFTNISKSLTSEFRFLKTLFLLLITISLLHILNLIILNNTLDPSYNWRWELHHVLIATLVYYMAIIGFKNSDTIHLKNNRRKKVAEVLDDTIIHKLEQAMKVDKLYLNPKLTLKELAKSLKVNESILSNAINVYYEKNFRKLINEARVAEVKSRLLNGELNNLSLLGIAKESGFNSEASFYRIFKSETQLTPKQFISNNLTLKTP